MLRFFSSLLKTPPIPSVPMDLFPRASVVRYKISQAEEPVRLTRYIKDLGICSRSQAERFLQSGMVKVDGARVSENIKVSKVNEVEIVQRNDVNTKKIPIPDETKLWVFYKPSGFTTTLSDPLKRPSVYHFLSSTKFPRVKIWTIGHLDFWSEGLMLLTNSQDLAEAAEFRNNTLAKRYEARVNGRVTSELLENIKKGMKFSQRTYKPMHVWKNKVKNSKNVWVGAILKRVHVRELRGIFERKRMHVNRIIRTHYGPYKLFGLKTGEFKEVEIDLTFHRLLFNYYKNKSLKQ